MKIKNPLLKFCAIVCLTILPQIVFSISQDITSIPESLRACNVPVCQDKIPVVVVIMVKNEEKVIVPTLKTYIDGGIKHVLLFDTGSTDKTIEKTEQYFKEINLETGYIVQDPFIPNEIYAEFPFDIFRNKALEVAEEKFPNAMFMLMPDAEWYLHGVKELIEFCKNNEISIEGNSGFLIKMGNTYSTSYTPRLIRPHHNVRFSGDIHEAPNLSSAKAPDEIFIELKTSKEGVSKSEARWHKDKIKLLKRFEQNEHDPRTLFYLAQTCECLNQLEDAQKYYKLRTENLSGWEEDYLAMFKLAHVTESIAAKTEKPDYSKALEYYDKAFTMRPTRAEPLVKAGQIHWRSGMYTTAYALALEALNLEFPAADTLTVDKYVYDFERYELMSKVAIHVRNFELGEKTARKTIEYAPHEPQYYRNLAIYLELKRFHAR